MIKELIDNLKGDQPEAMNLLVDFLKSDGIYFRLSGAAGTGKTYLMVKFVEYLVEQIPDIKIVQCAPTNKAVKVARKMATRLYSKVPSNISFRTVHSIMGVREKKVDGKVVYEPDAEPVINEYDLVIPDEYSMINRDMVELILKENEAKVIFVGDQNQLPPVGESYSLIEELDIPNFRMEEPIRQAASNPIIELSRKMIQRVYTPVPSWDSKLVGGNGVKQIQLRRNRDMTNELFLDYFTSDNFRNDSDFVKVLSFTNKTVSSYNTYIRKMYFDEEYLPKIVYGERLVVLNAIKDPTVDQKTMGEGRILFHTNDEIEVLSYDVITQSICGIDITFYEATVLDYDDKEKEQVINIIHEKSEQAYKGLLKNLAQTAKDQNKPELRKQMWKLFFQVKESFAEVTYSYALTVHKSQGSTYNNVFFDMQDLGYYSTYDFKKRLQYTAVTRASEKLYLIY